MKLSAPMGCNFDPEFKPELTPPQMLALGVFCGKYMTDTQNEFSKELVQACQNLHREPGLFAQLFRCRCQLPAFRVAEAKDGFILTIHVAGSNGIAVTTWAAACRKKISARSSAGRPFGATSPRCGQIVHWAILCVVPANVKPYCIGRTTAGKSESCCGRFPVDLFPHPIADRRHRRARGVAVPFDPRG